jgi:hypothetical protein
LNENWKFTECDCLVYLTGRALGLRIGFGLRIGLGQELNPRISWLSVCPEMARATGRGGGRGRERDRERERER